MENARTVGVALLGGLAALVLLLTIGGGLVMRTGMGWMMGGPVGMSAAGWGTLFFGALVLVGLLLLVAWGVGQFGRSDDAGRDRPLEILRERYARGEIGREDYERMRADLRGESPPL